MMADKASTDGRGAGRRILLIGGGSGIGQATVRLAAAQGCAVATTVLSDAEAAAVTAELPAVHSVVMNLTDRATLAPAMSAAIAHLGGLDALVYSAGIIARLPTADMADEAWDRLIEINLTGCFRAIKQALPALQQSKASPNIVVVSSQLGLVGYRNGAAYAASKWGLNGLVTSLALEFAPENLRINAVGPGPTATPMTAGSRADPEILKETVGNIPMGRYGKPEEIAEVIMFLASPAASFVTGQVWCADGGYVAK